MHALFFNLSSLVVALPFLSSLENFSQSTKKGTLTDILFFIPIWNLETTTKYVHRVQHKKIGIFY